MKIKTRKQREADYNARYSDISIDKFTRLQDDLGDRFNENLLIAADMRLKEIKSNTTYERVRFTFYEKPIQSHRPRSSSIHKGLYVPNAKANKKAMKDLLKDIKSNIKQIVTPMKIKVNAYYPMPTNANPLEKVVYELEGDYAIGKPDFDNVLKAYTDMMIGEIFLDDDLISSCEFNKYFSLKPRTELEIIYPNGFVSDWARKTVTNRMSYKKLENEGILHVSSDLIVSPYKELLNKAKRKRRNDE